MQWWKNTRAAVTNLNYWFLTPIFTAAVEPLCLTGLYLLVGNNNPQLLPVRHLPFWVQCLIILAIQDFMSYWIHRFFHGRRAWKFHAIHHSSVELDWMSAGRFHPVNLLQFVVIDLVILSMGFSIPAILMLAPINFIHSALVHANLNWTFGPLRYVIASPVFHRWHHTTQEEGLDKNFAGTFPVLDLMFGTFYMPRGKLPANYGINDPNFPEGFWQQMRHPFREKQAT
jgi:sterol desaturase/sphingolipid hydroxylase (fatty acid hydroxylase superfamily)